MGDKASQLGWLSSKVTGSIIIREIHKLKQTPKGGPKSSGEIKENRLLNAMTKFLAQLRIAGSNTSIMGEYIMNYELIKGNASSYMLNKDEHTGGGE